jgi:hypothetical protein
VPVDRPHPRPDGFRRGDRAARWGKQTDLKGDRSGRLRRVDPASGLPLPRPVRVAAVDEIRIDLIARRSFLPWALPLSGLSATPATFFVRSCVHAFGLVPECRVIGLRRAGLPRAYPLLGFAAVLPGRTIIATSCRRDAFSLPGLLIVPAKSPALQRVVGPMPGRSDEPRDPSDRLPV